MNQWHTHQWQAVTGDVLIVALSLLAGMAVLLRRRRLPTTTAALIGFGCLAALVAAAVALLTTLTADASGSEPGTADALAAASPILLALGLGSILFAALSPGHASDSRAAGHRAREHRPAPTRAVEVPHPSRDTSEEVELPGYQATSRDPQPHADWNMMSGVWSVVPRQQSAPDRQSRR